MYRFFINRPIVAMVIAIVMVLVGIVSMLTLPVAQFPNIVPPEIRLQTTFVGAEARTVAESVATPIEDCAVAHDLPQFEESLDMKKPHRFVPTQLWWYSEKGDEQILHDSS